MCTVLKTKLRNTIWPAPRHYVSPSMWGPIGPRPSLSRVNVAIHHTLASDKLFHFNGPADMGHVSGRSPRISKLIGLKFDIVFQCIDNDVHGDSRTFGVSFLNDIWLHDCIISITIFSSSAMTRCS